ncbi:L,D-transpeptidase [Dethiosulfovibrio salsuginis]|nr:L,D-transpeptidase [Dethiosulfovibrio salsuginis]
MRTNSMAIKRIIAAISFWAVILVATVAYCSPIDRWNSISQKATAHLSWAKDVVAHTEGSPVISPLWVCVKEEHLLFGLDGTSKTVFAVWPVATGRVKGQKQKVGDMRTPEGDFTVQRIDDASFWQPYKDKKTGETIGYGPWFIRIKTPPWTGIGIHGTDDDHLHEIGTDASHGCIRMANHSLLELKALVAPGQRVIILP